MSIPGYDDPAKAEKLIGDAKALKEKFEKDGTAVPVSPQMIAAKAAQAAGNNAKAQADLRLKQEMEKLDNSSSDNN
jgi:N utilization substance protein A